MQEIFLKFNFVPTCAWILVCNSWSDDLSSFGWMACSWVPDPWSTLFLLEPLPLCDTGWSDWTDKRQFGSLLSWNCEFDWLKDADIKPSEAERLTRCPWEVRSLKIRSSGPEWDVQLKYSVSHVTWVIARENGLNKPHARRGATWACQWCGHFRMNHSRSWGQIFGRWLNTTFVWRS